MNIFLDEHRKFLLRLMAADVEFMLVGGYAVIYHGYGRTTGDLDIWLKPDNENKKKFVGLMAGCGILPEDIDRLEEIDFTKAVAFHVNEPLSELTFLPVFQALSIPKQTR